MGSALDIVSANRDRAVPFLIKVVPTLSGDSFCFDTRHPDQRGEYPIVRYDHEVHGEESNEFETVARDLGEFLLGSLGEAPAPEEEESAAGSPESPGPGSIRKPSSLVRRQLRRFSRVIARVFFHLASWWYARALRRQGANIGRRPRNEMSPLQAAVAANEVQEASELLSGGADPNALWGSSTPLQCALVNKNRDMARLLLEHGANPRFVDSVAESTLQVAFEAGPALGAWMLQQVHDATLIDAAEAGTLDDLRELVDAGGEVIGVGQDGRRDSPLQAAVRRDDVEMAAFLLDRGADLNYRGAWDSPVLFIASTYKYSSKMTELLLRRGADPNATDRDGCTPLYLVARTHWPDVLEALIRGGADVNFRAPDGSTALHNAAAHNSDAESRAIHILVKHGANVNAQDRQGFTPLHAAIDRVHAAAAMTLLDLGADPTIRDNEGRTPVQLVREAVRSYPGIPEVVRRIGTGDL